MIRKNSGQSLSDHKLHNIQATVIWDGDVVERASQNCHIVVGVIRLQWIISVKPMSCSPTNNYC